MRILPGGRFDAVWPSHQSPRGMTKQEILVITTEGEMPKITREEAVALMPHHIPGIEAIYEQIRVAATAGKLYCEVDASVEELEQLSKDGYYIRKADVIGFSEIRWAV